MLCRGNSRTIWCTAVSWDPRRWRLRLREVADGGDRLADHAVVGLGIVGGPANFVFHVGHGLEHELGDVGEGCGFAWRDSPLRESLENSAENVVDVETGIEIAGERSKVGGELFSFKELLFFAGMEDAKSRMAGLAEHAATASIGERAETPGLCCLLGLHKNLALNFGFRPELPQGIAKNREGMREFPKSSFVNAGQTSLHRKCTKCQ